MPYNLVPEGKLSFSPISASDQDFNPQNIQCIPAVKILIFLTLTGKRACETLKNSGFRPDTNCIFIGNLYVQVKLFQKGG